MITVTFKGPLVIEEATHKDFLVLKGVFLNEGLSKNGHWYGFSELKRIAKDIIGKPVNWGARLVDSGGFKHLKEKVHQIGEVVEAWVDKNRIMGRIKVYNTPEHPNLLSYIRQVGESLGFSIGGKARGLEPIMDQNGKPVLIRTGHGFLAKVVGFIAEHLQLLAPDIPRGQDQAKVTAIEEVLHVAPDLPVIKPQLTVEALIGILKTRGVI